MQMIQYGSWVYVTDVPECQMFVICWGSKQVWFWIFKELSRWRWCFFPGFSAVVFNFKELTRTRCHIFQVICLFSVSDSQASFTLSYSLASTNFIRIMIQFAEGAIGLDKPKQSKRYTTDNLSFLFIFFLLASVRLGHIRLLEKPRIVF